MRKSTLPLLAILFAFHATPAGNFALTIDNIMRGPGLYGYEPSQVRWSGDGERLYFQWKQASDPSAQGSRYVRRESGWVGLAKAVGS